MTTRRLCAAFCCGGYPMLHGLLCPRHLECLPPDLRLLYNETLLLAVSSRSSDLEDLRRVKAAVRLRCFRFDFGDAPLPENLDRAIWLLFSPAEVLKKLPADLRVAYAEAIEAALTEA